MRQFRLLAYALVVSSIFYSCTISVILTDTHGSATDVVDQTSRVDPEVQADVDVSAAKIPPTPSLVK